MNILVAGAYLWGAIYTTAVFGFAYAWDRPSAVFLGLLTAGAAYLCQVSGAISTDPAQPKFYSHAALGLMLAAIASGAAAGFVLFI